ncbi:hypothetical protein OBBRIDRAFT_805627 [Obba rivulosa]|uniref:Uncharacterized protein n=1 Tax=Obba rivulosa TaxID=1052685 RepID=A0A8E2ATU2_9APHY|nr:hypothetical protein OBBRIDRAFT_805627 [Obba rivulosa]
MSSSGKITADNTLGAFLLGVVIAAVYMLTNIQTSLYGITCLQSYLYYKNYEEDTMLLKGTICAMHAMYIILVTHNGSTNALGTLPWSIHATIVLTPVLLPGVEISFRHLVVTRGNYWVTAPAFLSNLTSCATALVLNHKQLYQLWRAHLKIVSSLPMHSFNITISCCPAGPLCFTRIGSCCGCYTCLFVGGIFVEMLHRVRAVSALVLSLMDSVVRVLMLYSVNTTIITSMFRSTVPGQKDDDHDSDISFQSDTMASELGFLYSTISIPLGRLQNMITVKFCSHICNRYTKMWTNACRLHLNFEPVSKKNAWVIFLVPAIYPSSLKWSHLTVFQSLTPFLTESMVQVLMLYCINIALLTRHVIATSFGTSVCKIASFITFATMPDNFVYYTFFTILPKSTYNARNNVREIAQANENFILISLTFIAHSRAVGSSGGHDSQVKDIQVYQTMETDSDISKHV